MPLTDRQKLERALEYHRERARACEIALQLLDEDATQLRAARSSSVLAEALAARHHANGSSNGTGHAHAAPKKKIGRPPKPQTAKHAPGYGSADQKLARRKKTAAWLATLHHDRPTVPEGDATLLGIGPLIASGYIRKHKAGGYVRTAKEFVP